MDFNPYALQFSANYYNNLVEIPLPGEEYTSKRPLTKVFFLFLRIYCRLQSYHTGTLSSVPASFFWSLFSYKLRNADKDLRPTEKMIRGLGKLLKKILQVYYVKGHEPSKYAILSLNESMKLDKIRDADKSFIIICILYIFIYLIILISIIFFFNYEHRW